jgi:hypothetical protein
MWTQTLQDGRTEADVRDEVAVHDVKMQPVGSRGLYRCNFLVQTREIRSQQTWRNSYSTRS